MTTRPVAIVRPPLTHAEHLLRFQVRQDARQERRQRPKNRTPERRDYFRDYYQANKARHYARIKTYRHKHPESPKAWSLKHYYLVLVPRREAKRRACREAGHVIPKRFGRPPLLCPACRGKP